MASNETATGLSSSNPFASSEVALAELIAALSLATDLEIGQPVEHALRTCLLAMRLAKALGCDEATTTEVYYLALLRRVGCTADAHELASWFGDEIAAHARAFTLDFGRPATIVADVLRHAGRDAAWWQRLRTIASIIAAGPRAADGFFLASCEAAQRLAGQLGFGPAVQWQLGQMFERWDGRGTPGLAGGKEIALAVRIVQVAEDAEFFRRIGGSPAVTAMTKERRGGAYDPDVADCLSGAVDRLLKDVDQPSIWAMVIESEPVVRPVLTNAQLDDALLAVARFTDLKLPHMGGHSPLVASLASLAAAQLGLPDADIVAARRAALIHDVGRTSVPNGIWEKTGPLADSEWERVRLYPYYTERIFSRPRALRKVGELAAMHRERLDGSGYPRRVHAPALPIVARILAAADVYQSLTETRPYRPAHSPEAASNELRREARAGRLDHEAVGAVLVAAGHRSRRAPAPLGLSRREIEVLRLAAGGLSRRQIARMLGISPHTADHHIRHIYAKIGVSTRAGAALFAMQHNLLGDISES